MTSGVHIRRGIVAVLLALLWLAVPASGAEPADRPTGWADLSRVEQDGTRIPIAQQFDRATIVMVARPRSVAFKLPAPLNWMLQYAGPCPNCDVTQTALAGETPLPSPLPRKADTDPRVGEVLYRAPVSAITKPLDDVTWERLRLLLPASLRGKQPAAP